MYPKVSLKVESAPSSNEECNNKEPGAPSLSFAKSRSPHHPNLTATVIRNSPKIIFGQHQQTSSSTSGTSQSSSRHPIQTALISSQPVSFWIINFSNCLLTKICTLTVRAQKLA